MSANEEKDHHQRLSSDPPEALQIDKALIDNLQNALHVLNKEKQEDNAQWFMTKSLIFPSSISSCVNLSEELKKCVNREQRNYDQLVDDFQRLVRRFEENDREMIERLKIFDEIRDEMSKATEFSSMNDVFQSHLWQTLFEMSSDLEHRSYEIVLSHQSPVDDEYLFKRQ